MRNLSRFLFLFSISLWLLTCEKEGPEIRPYPQVRTLGVNAITSEGACFNGEIMNPAGYEITDHGFVFSISEDPSYDYGIRIALGAASTEGPFSTVISSNLRTDAEYYVKAWVKTADKTILGLPVKFISLGSMAPVVNDFFPKTGTWGDTITIAGKNFGNNSSDCISYFGTVKSRVFAINDTIIKTIVPESLSEDSCLIAVEVFGNRGTAKDKFLLDYPVRIQNITPQTDLEWGDTLSITGVFPPEYRYEFFLDDIKADIVNTSSNSFKIIVPDEIMNYDSCTLHFSFDEHRFSYGEALTLKKPYVAAYDNECAVGDTMEISGYFSPKRENNKVVFGETEASVIQLNTKIMKVIVPDVFLSFKGTVYVTSGGISILNQSFSIPEPIVTGYQKHIAHGDILRISGRNFIPKRTQLKINNEIPENAPIITFNAITFVNPYSNGKYSFSVSTFSNTFNGSFDVATPKISSIEPASATFNDTVTINLENINGNSAYQVDFNDLISYIIDQNDTAIKTKVPAYLTGNSKVNICVWFDNNYYPDLCNYVLKIIKPEVAPIDSITGRAGDIITISGRYFSPLAENNRISFEASNGYSAEKTASSASDDQLSFIVPRIYGYEYSVFLKLLDYKIPITGHYKHIDPWKQIFKYPTTAHDGSYFSSCFVLGDKAYYTGGWESYGTPTKVTAYYSFTDEKYYIGPDYPGGPRTHCVSFVLDGYGYVGSGYGYYNAGESSSEKNDFYRFDPTSNSWSAIQSFPGTGRNHAFSFTFNGKAYIGSGFNNYVCLQDIWEYDPATDSWKKMNDFPDALSHPCRALTIGGKVYLIHNKDVWQYDELNDTWQKIGTFPGSGRHAGVYFSAGGYGYYGGGVTFDNLDLDDFWRFDANTNTWKRLPSLGESTYGCKSFTYDDRGYVIYGESDKFIEYDPSNEVE